MVKKTEIIVDEYIDVLEKIKERITQAQYQVMTNANVERNILFWNIGNVILQYSQWGNKFVETLSKDLRMTYPSREGYSVRNLNYMKQFARRIPSEEILHQGGAKLMELTFCGKRDARAVLVLYKYCPYFRDFVGICSNLVLMLRRYVYCPNSTQSNISRLRSRWTSWI